MNKSKKTIFFVQASRTSPLSFSEQLYLSCLWHRANRGKGSTQRELAGLTRLEPGRTLPKIRARLAGLGLIRTEDGKVHACEPAGERCGWFVPRKAPRPVAWHQRYRYFPVWLRSPASPLTAAQNVLYWKLRNLGGRRRVTHAYLATLLRVHRKTVARAIKELTERGLISWKKHRGRDYWCFSVSANDPAPDQMAWFLDKPARAGREEATPREDQPGGKALARPQPTAVPGRDDPDELELARVLRQDPDNPQLRDRLLPALRWLVAEIRQHHAFTSLTLANIVDECIEDHLLNGEKVRHCGFLLKHRLDQIRARVKAEHDRRQRSVEELAMMRAERERAMGWLRESGLRYTANPGRLDATAVEEWACPCRRGDGPCARAVEEWGAEFTTGEREFLAHVCRLGGLEARDWGPAPGVGCLKHYRYSCSGCKKKGSDTFVVVDLMGQRCYIPVKQNERTEVKIVDISDGAASAL